MNSTEDKRACDFDEAYVSRGEVKVEIAGVNFNGSSNNRKVAMHQHTPIKNNEVKLLPTNVSTSKSKQDCKS